MNYNINSSGLYDVNAYNFTAYNATILSSLTVNGSTLATNTNLNNLSTSSILSINNLNNTSTTIFNNLNSLSTSSILSINNLNNTSTTIFNNLNSLSTYSSFNISNTNDNVNNISNYVYTNIPAQSDEILHLDATSTTIFNNLNSFSSSSSLSINNLNATSTTIFNNLNSFSSSSSLSINNLNATSTTLLSYINNLTNPSTLNTNNLNVSGTSKLNNSTSCISSLNVSGITTLSNKTIIKGILNIHNGTPYATANYTLNNGSLIIGDTLLNYGGGTLWNGGNAAGLLMECDNNTEIVVHDNGKRLASLMYYEGDTTNRITIGRNMGWDAISNVTIECGTLIVGNNNSYPNIQLGSTNGHNLGVATTAGAFSTSSNAGDLILRSLNRLILQSGGGGYGIMIDSNNYVYFNKSLLLNIDNVDRSVVENRIFTSGSTLTGVFAGDTILTAYWGVAINLNYGGSANGYGGGNNARSYVPGYSAFTINMRSSTSQTTFDKRLFTVMPDGTTTINGTLTAGNINGSGIANIHNGSGVGVSLMASGSLTIGGTNTSYGGNFYTGAAWTGNNTAGLLLECQDNTEIVVHDSATRLASLMYYEGGSNKITIGRNMGWTAISSIVLSNNVGINNTSPWVDLNLGNVDVGGSSGGLVFGKNNGGGGIRNFRQGMSSNFFFCIGDCGNVNNSSAPWTLQMAISYQAPSSSFTISSTGQVIMPNGYSTSDERIKSNIKTIENALEKTLLLRGVEYNNFKIEPDKKCLGLIAQEVELIIPEVVSVNEVDNIKCISYTSLVGVLIEAIKDQQQQINELKLILKNNNLN